VAWSDDDGVFVCCICFSDVDGTGVWRLTARVASGLNRVRAACNKAFSPARCRAARVDCGTPRSSWWGIGVGAWEEPRRRVCPADTGWANTSMDSNRHCRCWCVRTQISDRSPCTSALPLSRLIMHLLLAATCWPRSRTTADHATNTHRRCQPGLHTLTNNPPRTTHACTMLMHHIAPCTAHELHTPRPHSALRSRVFLPSYRSVCQRLSSSGERRRCGPQQALGAVRDDRWWFSLHTSIQHT
jgi:hypothetical protein